MASVGPRLTRPPILVAYSLSFVFSFGVTFYKVVVYAVWIFFISLLLLGKQNEVINQGISETLSMSI